MRFCGSGRLAQALAPIKSTMNYEALIALGGVVLALGAVGAALAAIVVALSRGAVRRERSRSHIRVTGLGMCFGVAQTLVMFSVAGWGFFHPETFLGHVVAHRAGVLAIIAVVGFGCMPISYVLQRAGVVLFVRSQGGG